jgi:hypothetical protein
MRCLTTVNAQLDPASTNNATAKKDLVRRRKLFASRNFGLALDGVLIAALIDAEENLTVQETCKDIITFFTSSLDDKDKWRENIQKIMEPGPNNTAKYFKPSRFAHGWGQLQTIVNPRSVEVPAASGVGHSV